MSFGESIALGLALTLSFILLCFVINPRLRAWLAFHWHRVRCEFEEGIEERSPTRNNDARRQG
jgi:hypothetical protein